jgi:hypothetical protein
MGFQGRGWRRSALAWGVVLALFPVTNDWLAPSLMQVRVLVSKEVSEMLGAAGLLNGSEGIRLAEVVQREDSVIYRTDSKDWEYQKRQREERDKEKKSWEMLNNVIIDGRQPPRRFSDPRPNDYPR